MKRRGDQSTELEEVGENFSVANGLERIQTKWQDIDLEVVDVETK